MKIAKHDVASAIVPRGDGVCDTHDDHRADQARRIGWTQIRFHKEERSRWGYELGGVIVMAEYAVHRVAESSGRTARLGDKGGLIAWAEVDRLALQVRVQLAGRDITRKSMDPLQKIGQQAFVIQTIHGSGNAKLPHVGSTHGSSSSLFRSPKRWKQHRRQHRNDGDYDQEFNERETAVSG
jgi:hypothetical protein